MVEAERVARGLKKARGLGAFNRRDKGRGQRIMSAS